MAREGNVACVVSPNGADVDLAVRILSMNGIQALGIANIRCLANLLDNDAPGCAVLVEEALMADEMPVLREALDRMPAWWDLPLIIISRDVVAFRALTARAFPRSGNVTMLERPLNPLTLVSAVEVALRATGNQRAVAELIAQREKAIQHRDEFLAMLAHELRNPLAPMRNALYIMRKAKLQGPLVRKTAEILERQVNHVVRLVDDLMDVARLERGKVNLQKQRIDLIRVVSSAVDTCLQAAQEKGHHVSVHFGSETLQVDADPVRMEQIVCNLINNAAKFSPSPGEIRLESTAEGPFALIAVQDRGIGFDPAAGEHLFDPFLQANPTLERSAGGLGMGLTIVKRLAELHGGTVVALSEGPGKGARLEVRIPIASGTITAPPQREQPSVGAQRCCIVVIEDNPDIRETLGMLLTQWGHDVKMASDGPSGVECVMQHHPDVAIIDVGLPLMNGYDVARAIRRAIPNGIRLIAVTGYGQPSDKELALQAGFDTHLLKPIAPEALELLLS